jgi:hypothetical protein
MLVFLQPCCVANLRYSPLILYLGTLFNCIMGYFCSVYLLLNDKLNKMILLNKKKMHCFKITFKNI